MVKNERELESLIDLTSDEKAWFDDLRSKSLEFGISDYVSPLLASTAIRTQFVPRVQELEDISNSSDPLMEEESSKFTARLIHRYENRIALLLTDCCFSYCRHCFRRRFTSHRAGEISDKDIALACKYIEENSIEEALLTGGDALVLSNSRLDFIINALRGAKKDIIIRLCTRAIFSNPSRFDDGLFSLIEMHNKPAPLFLMVQFNHPDELTKEVVNLLKRIRLTGVQMFNQAVLLKGVNDDVDVQVQLSKKLLLSGVKPYYLFLLDKVNGIEHFRVSVNRAMEIERGMRARLSGLQMPQLAVDLPQSGGKIPITYNYIQRLNENGTCVFISPDGNIREY